jgi:hypothetical protein
MATNREKFNSLVQDICWACMDDPSRLGAVKLNKTLWRADFQHFLQHGESITGARYVKQRLGPVPSSIQPALAELQKKGILRVEDVPYFEFTKKQYHVTAPSKFKFTESELLAVKNALQEVCHENTATSISDKSHDHVWQAAAVGEEIPYYTVFSVHGTISDDDREWASMTLEQIAANGSFN